MREIPADGKSSISTLSTVSDSIRERKTERKRTNNIGKNKPYAYNNSKKGYKTSSKIITESEYWDKYEEIKNTGKIEHKTLGEGVVKRISGDTIEVEFENKTSKMKLKFLMEKDLIR